jgi:hypothetical protein
MKTTHNILNALVLLVLTTLVPIRATAQIENKPSLAIVAIESKDMDIDNESARYLVRLEVEKTKLFNVFDKYDEDEVLKSNKIDIKTCLGKTCVLSAGKLLKADKMITGSIERIEQKIVISLKIIDVKSETIEKQDATEYINLQTELQKMVTISIQKLLGITPDKDMVSLLINYEAPISTPHTKATYSGPRMGATFYLGDAGKVLHNSVAKGGYNMYPVMFEFGWQQEIRYMSSGNFHAIIEILPMISGLEQGKFIPYLTLMNGFRMGKGGWEIAFGPSIRFIKKAEGFWDNEGYLGEKGEWHLSHEWNSSQSQLWDTAENFIRNPYSIEKRMDSRGRINVSTSLMISVGKTFKSGYLNIPLNLYASLRKEGTIIGVSFGFNITKGAKKKKLNQ